MILMTTQRRDQIAKACVLSGGMIVAVAMLASVWRRAAYTVPIYLYQLRNSPNFRASLAHALAGNLAFWILSALFFGNLLVILYKILTRSER